MKNLKTKFFQLRVDDDFLRMLDEMRRHEPDLPRRTEMVFRLIAEAATARAQKIKRKAA